MACEKCWADAFNRWMSNPEKDQASHYADLLAERKDHPCTPDGWKWRAATTSSMSARCYTAGVAEWRPTPPPPLNTCGGTDVA